MQQQRIIELGGVRNLRDVGGYPSADGKRQTVWRALFRSGCLDELDEDGQRWVIDAGVRTLIDLRDSTEVC
jgi:protein-tyrosine phosphatase